MATVIIAEKPTAARSIAKALAEKDLKENVTEEGVKWYEFSKKNRKYHVVAAVGHLFTLKNMKKGQDYPIFDLDWIPTFQASKFSAFTKKYFDVVQKVAVNGDDFIIATDYDTEGEVIGYNILKFLCKKEDAKRMKFSTMTKEELEESFEKMSKHIDFGQAEAGLTRHYLDHMWGVSISRALIAAIKSTGRRFQIISTGRVQGPTLHMLYKHEKKIQAFKPKPFWEIKSSIKIGKQELDAEYEKDKIWDKKEADDVLKSIKGKKAVVKDISKKIMLQKPPKPYNTTSFLADVYRYFGYSPQQTMSIAEALYQAGLISYPRTSSEKLPPDINYKKIIIALGKQKHLENTAKELLAMKKLVPEQGSKTDAAHPALYPTGEMPKKIGDLQKKVYDLVVRRFFACFGEPAKRESQKVALDINDNVFFIRGTKTIEPGWTKLYGKYAGREEIILPEIRIGEKFSVSNPEQLSKQTQPPARFSQGSVMKEMEAKNLGTKSTRPAILQTLYNRGYIVGRSIETTELGNKLSEILEKNIPDIVSEKLTRHFEQECDDVSQNKIKRQQVLDEAKKTLITICKIFRKKEARVGKLLTEAIIEAQEKANRLGTCPVCGGVLRIHKLWATGNRFVGCSGFKKGCKFSAPLPRIGMLMPTDKVCEECKSPIIQVRREGKKLFRMCVDIHCPTKKEWFDKKKIGLLAQKKENA
ncbi:MAG: DNA topoisomerase I [Candidatus Aenigmarchaeota archaeon]|nr:DNA topoisomerase I [Candidatus Aenigmarchaeota archaeon]